MKYRISLLFLLVFAGLFLAGCTALSMGGTSLPERIQIDVQVATDEFLDGYDYYLDLSWVEEGDLQVVFTSKHSEAEDGTPFLVEFYN